MTIQFYMIMVYRIESRCGTFLYLTKLKLFSQRNCSSCILLPIQHVQPLNYGTIVVFFTSI